MEYEVRPEYKDSSLSELLDTSVMSFQGVGDTQHEILNRFFGVKTIRDLANLPFFLSALGIQEQALKQESNGEQPVSEIAKSESLKFSVRPDYLDKTPKELLASPVRVLDGLTPAQSLALYDAFRVTNVIQLAQNRIMLEARIIEYLQRVESGEIPEADMNTQIASILLSSVGLPTAEDARRLAQEGPGEGDLRSLTGSLAVHLRERLEALRDRAREKAEEIAGRPSPSQDELAEEASRVRPPVGMDARNRLDSIRESRQRPDAALGSSVGGRPGAEAASAVVAARAAMQSDMRARRAGGATIAGRPLPRPAPAAQPSAATTPPGGEVAAEAMAQRVAEQAAMAERPEPPRQGMDWRLPLAAAAAILVIAGGIWVWMRSTEPPVSVTGVMEQPAPSPAQETRPGEAALPGQAIEGPAGQPGQAGAQAGPQAAAVSPRAESSSGAEALPIKTIHTVSWGQSLWRISRGHYNDPEKWPWIYRANRDQISNPDLIYPRQRVKIPIVKK
jgi:hypothetical protein